MFYTFIRAVEALITRESSYAFSAS